jgi:hypothetical protein
VLPRRFSLVIVAVALVGLLMSAHVQAQRGPHGPRTRVVVGVGWGSPYWSPFWSPFWSPYYSPFWSPFWGPVFWPPVGFSGVGFVSEVRIQATPREAEVFVDGFLVGIVDDFDGWSQRLRLAPGEHEIELFLDGHRSVRERMLFRPGETYRIRATLEKADPSEPPATRPAPSAAARDARTLDEPAGVRDVEPRPSEARGFGTLSVRVQPADAIILVNGERWDRPDGDARLTLELAPGRHDIEVCRDGHVTYRSTVEVRPGQVTSVNVSLPVTEGGM